MQYLIDRDFIASDIYQGRALPMFTNISPTDYDQLTIFPVVSKANIRYDNDLATKQITDAMNAAGASKDGDSWTFNGNPIQIKIVTRVEDERRDIGDLVRSSLETLGFQVAPQYQEFGPATLAVYASDPKTFQWHIYTEGWSRGAPVRYDDAGINQFAAPWLGNMPGWQEVGYWQYQNDQLDELGKKLYRGEFASEDDRDSLYQQMAQIALDESVRVWLVTALQSFPVRTDVENLTLDIVSGPRNVFALRGADIPGRTDIKVGNLWVWTERTTWNPVGGFGDAYSSDIYKNLVDPRLFNHPFTGLPHAFRIDFTVDTAGPDGTMDVPAEALIWDAKQNVWAPVASGTTAKSKVTFDYSKFLGTTWQHGQPITMADVIYPIAQGYEIAYDDDKVQIETALGITSRPLLETFKGYVFGDKTIDVYVDYWHFDDGYIASYASPIGGIDSVGDPGGDGRCGFREANGRLLRHGGGAVQRAVDQPGDRIGCAAGAALGEGIRAEEDDSRGCLRYQRHDDRERGRGQGALRRGECLVRRDESAGDRQRSLQTHEVRSAGAVRSARCLPARGISLHRGGFPLRRTAAI